MNLVVGLFQFRIGGNLPTNSAPTTPVSSSTGISSTAREDLSWETRRQTHTASVTRCVEDRQTAVRQRYRRHVVKVLIDVSGNNGSRWSILPISKPPTSPTRKYRKVRPQKEKEENKIARVDFGCRSPIRVLRQLKSVRKDVASSD